MIYEKAPAKINLTLDVLHKREDGYHEVEMVMTTIDLADRLAFEMIHDDRVEIASENRFVPNDKRNLAFQAATIMKEKYHIKKGVRIHLNKNIPVAAGLAGGSSDAAATIRGINRLFELKLSQNELLEVAAQIGSDVPFCVIGGTALAKGRGEQLKPLPSPPSCWIVLAKPDVGISTKDVYGQVKLDHIKHPNTSSVIEALENQDFLKMCANLSNVLEPITTNMHSKVEQIKSKMINANATGVLMSGSGPTVFSLVLKQAKAERIYNSLRGFCSEVYMVRMLG
ncbi:4-(cytidine 5'-diphospho)-2-C-methyl-D-erythritol kinase [Tenuibacillus multivorans]|uniref:4-diphosphocytidyl-2-C-methyl-D-erythritol kinase n=1 Tax=Tenuibacillus multivorans TaxID=237069 RepID=A0A1G9VZX0_9BACI|nr:4-(cytidine 5'-diphospho)-2-C-methyl-D-erythritol kinase [Tenuibacillus multivorans]GEL78264.1 4-diphosphocytidyl-2-C-methyl-D-erythritol kinase [Tenuibacillus multivorans]SDM77868.1 4-diphosphocytidyl-2-C-methyl-D-erythritol kinase [Tenuibacillus multivorans]